MEASETGFARTSPKPRIAVATPATLVLEDGREAGCQLMDISADGFRAKTSHIGPPASYRKLISGRDTFDIEVRWITGPELGGIFL